MLIFTTRASNRVAVANFLDREELPEALLWRWGYPPHKLSPQ
jgi:hypothetical protein